MTPSDSRRELDIQLERIEQQLTKQLSFKHNFLISIVRGVGYALGATIIAGLLLTMLSWSIDSIQDVPLFNKILLDPQLTSSFNTVNTNQ